MFLTKEELYTKIYQEILDAIVRNDSTIVEVTIQASVSEMKSYLSDRFDVNLIFGKSGDNRHPLILDFLKDITVYHLHSIYNPDKIPQIRKDRYDRAIQWLKDVAKDLINPDLPLINVSSPSGSIAFGSNKKRNNHY